MKKIAGAVVLVFFIFSNNISYACFDRVESLTLSPGSLSVTLIDQANGYAFVASNGIPGTIYKIDLGSPSRPGSRFGVLQTLTFVAGDPNQLSVGENTFSTGVIDPVNGYAYFGTATTSPHIVKIDLGTSPGRTFRRAGGWAIANTGGPGFQSSVIDLKHGYAYFGTYSAPGRIYRINLVNFGAAPTFLTMATNADQLISAVIDPDTDDGYAFFATNGSFYAPHHTQVIKVNLGSFSVDSTLLLGESDYPLKAAVIDPARGFAYFGTNNTSNQIIKIDLGTLPGHVFARADSFSSSNPVLSGVIDSSNGYAYMGSYSRPVVAPGVSAPGRILKINLTTFSEESVFEFNPINQDRNFSSSGIDLINGFAYFGSGYSPGDLVKMDILPGDCRTFVTSHPADANSDFLMGLNEATFYGACWKKAPDTSGGCPASAELNYAVRAGTLWNASANGQYQYNSANTCPFCWEVKP